MAVNHRGGKTTFEVVHRYPGQSSACLGVCTKFHAVSALRPGDAIEYCCVPGKLVDFARLGKHCFHADPQFVNPTLSDFSLQPTSPCRGTASDDGHLGCRFTPEMLEMLEVARKLRAQGLIKF